MLFQVHSSFLRPQVQVFIINDICKMVLLCKYTAHYTDALNAFISRDVPQKSCDVLSHILLANCVADPDDVWVDEKIAFKIQDTKKTPNAWKPNFFWKSKSISPLTPSALFRFVVDLHTKRLHSNKVLLCAYHCGYTNHTIQRLTQSYVIHAKKRTLVSSAPSKCLRQ